MQQLKQFECTQSVFLLCMLTDTVSSCKSVAFISHKTAWILHTWIWPVEAYKTSAHKRTRCFQQDLERVGVVVNGRK